jgi:hypothetical protein
MLPEQAPPPPAKTAKWPLHMENPAMMQKSNTVTVQQHTSRMDAHAASPGDGKNGNVAVDGFPTNEPLNSN